METTPGDSGDAPGHAEEPGNSGEAPGHQDDAAPTAEVAQGGSVGQSADASGSADQRDVDNTAASVRIDEPGHGRKVGQENRAAADAAAATEASVDSPGETAVAQSAEAEASASQTDVSNTSIVVRVGSAGDDEGVSQANVATGSAAATTTTANAHAAAAAEATQDGVANTSVSVRVFSPGDDGPVTQLNAASATADASPGGSESATVRQDGLQNTTVSIRVESPGSAAAPSQQNEATVVTSRAVDSPSTGGVAVAVAGDARNTVLTVAVGGANLDRPGASGLQVWIWTWVWQRDETQDLAALSGLEPDSWSWGWDGAGGVMPSHGNVTSRAADDDDRADAGSLEWSWDWTRAGVASWSWDWSRQLQLSCASCIWIWNWSWSWTGQPGGDDDVTAPRVGAASSPPAQLNAVTAQASANASAGVVQTVVQSGAGGATQFAGQLAAVSQDVRTSATAQQSDVSSLLLGDATAQSNLAASAALGGVVGTASQAIVQSLDAAGSARGDQWGGQEIAMAQLAEAAASAMQHDVLLLSGGSHIAASNATAGGAAAVEQQLAQDAVAGTGAFSQWAGQLALVEQAADGMSTVVQTGSAGSRRTGGAATAAAEAGNLALVGQQTEQSAWRDGGLGLQSAMQRVYTGQEASASAVTFQQTGADARSDADSRTRSKVLQDASQRATGSSALVQDLLQEAIVLQRAVASSTSHGGIGGVATVLDCAVVQQAATQSIGVDAVSISRPDGLSFCLPPEAPSSSPPVVLGPPTATGGELAAVAGGATPAEGSVALAAGAPPTAATGAHGSAEPRRPVVARPTQGAGGVPTTSAHAQRVPGYTQFSVPPSTQARIDTRPGSHAGAGDAGRESPLPPAGDPSNGVSALAAAASGAGPSGITAILTAFVLAAPVLLRSPRGSVVRRPTDVLTRIDVPV
ncbi:MAG TPA: hypothetical protein VGF10_07935 [Gaiella sp.]